MSENNENDEIRNTFKAKYVGRGVWYVIHSQIASIINNVDNEIPNDMLLKTLHGFFMIYCENIYCSICREHAFEFIATNEINIETVSLDEYFAWIYDFHFHANLNSNREFERRSLKTVQKHYLHDKIFDDLNYEQIQTGVWHLFFILATKCKHNGYVLALYNLFVNIFSEMVNINNIFIEYLEEFNFLEVFKNEDEDELGDLLFDYMYSVYCTINIKLNIKCYDLEFLKNIYYNLDSCDDSCDL